MSKREYLSRYNLIIKKVSKAPADFEAIYNYLERESEIQGYNFRVSKRTFQRDLDEIRSMYDIDIQYDFSRKAYFIAEEPQSDANTRMLEAFDLFQSLKLSENVSEFICFEKRKSQGTQYLLNLLYAVKNQQVIHVFHQKFDKDEPVEHILEPVAIKESRGRWYLVAYVVSGNHVRTFGLDRMVDLTIQKQRFTPKSFDVNEYYKDCFGIIRPEEDKPQEVILSFTFLQGQYIKTCPLHQSQKLILENENEIQFSLKLYITFDFVQELLSHRELVKVVSPKSLVIEMKKISSEISSTY